MKLTITMTEAIEIDKMLFLAREWSKRDIRDRVKRQMFTPTLLPKIARKLHREMSK